MTILHSRGYYCIYEYCCCYAYDSGQKQASRTACQRNCYPLIVADEMLPIMLCLYSVYVMLCCYCWKLAMSLLNTDSTRVAWRSYESLFHLLIPIIFILCQIKCCMAIASNFISARLRVQIVVLWWASAMLILRGATCLLSVSTVLLRDVEN